MSLSGAIYVILTSFAFAACMGGRSGTGIFVLLCSVVFLFTAIYHDEQQRNRIAELERKLKERGGEDD